MNKDLVRKVFLSTVPVFAGYIVLGIGFGLLLRTAGYGAVWAFFMSLFIYAGSMQYIAIDLMTGGASFITTAVTTLLVNGRHMFYGISLIDKYKKLGKLEPLAIYTLTDETYSLVVNDEPGLTEEEQKARYILTSVMDWSYWIMGSLIGNIGGAIIPFDTTGVDFSMTALFVTIVTEQWLSMKDHTSAFIGFGCSFVCLIIFGAANFLIPSMACIAAMLIFLRKWKDPLYKERGGENNAV